MGNFPADSQIHQCSLKFILIRVLKKVLLYCFFPLLSGVLFYIFFHKADLLLHRWLNSCSTFPNYYNLLKNNFGGKLLLNHFADIAWCYSLSHFLRLFYFVNLSHNTSAALIILIVSFTEIIQLFFPKQFTFDWIDLFICFLIPLLIFKLNKNENKNSF